MIRKICLLLVPDESAIFGKEGMKMPPLSIGIITSHLRQNGFTVDPVDLHQIMGNRFSEKDLPMLEPFFDRDSVFNYMDGGPNDAFDGYAEKLLGAIDIDKYDLIAYSAGSSMSWLQIHSALILGRYVKQRWGKTQVFGGINIGCTSMFSPVYDEMLKLFLDHFQYLIKGPGEEVLLQVIDSLNQGNGYERIKELPGVAHVTHDGKLRFNLPGNRKIIRPDFDGLDLDYYANYSNKKNPGETITALYGHPFLFTRKLQAPPEDTRDRYEKKLVIPYVFNYGCPYNCAFCTESGTGPDAIVIGKVDTVVDHLEALVEKYRTPYFYFINNAINYSKKYIENLCDAISKRNLNIYWSDCARFNNIDLNILQKMKDAGCRKLVFGLETASPAVLDRIDKKLDLAFTEQVLKWCHELGIRAELEIIVGIPTETEESFEESHRFLTKNIKYLNFLTVNKYIPYPQSKMFYQPEEFGIEITQRTSYEENLAKDLALFKKKEITGLHSHILRVFQYGEINGRSREQVLEDTDKRHEKLQALLDSILRRRVMSYIKKGYLSMKDIAALNQSKNRN